MEKRLNDAISQTTLKWGKNQTYGAISTFLLSNNAEYFSNANGNGRDYIETMPAEKIKDEFIMEYLNIIFSNNYRGIKTYLEEAIYETYKKYINDPKGVENILVKCIKEGLNGLNIFTRDNLARKRLDDFLIARNKSLERYIAERIAETIVNENERKLHAPIQNVQIFPDNIEKGRNAILTGVNWQYTTKDAEARIGNLYAVSNVGTLRKNQEDAVLLIEHPKNPEFKFLAVADGMGGMEAGEKASAYTLIQMREWFKTIPAEYFELPEKLKVIIKNKLSEISNDIKSDYQGKSGTTFVGAIVGKDTTLMVNVGDSRGYILYDGKLQQVTEDQSPVWERFKRGFIAKKDDIRFNKESNFINQSIGTNRDIIPEFNVLNNKDYSTILLFSDGVTDCLSDEDIMIVCKNTDKKMLAKELVNTALKKRSLVRDELRGNPNYYGIVEGGKDNATAAQFTKNS